MGGDETGSLQLIGSFAVVDDIIWEAAAGRLNASGQIDLAPSGQIGPLFEIARAREGSPFEFTTVTFRSPAAASIRAALDDQRPSGTEQGAMFGVFPLALLPPDGTSVNDVWTQWAARADQAAKRAGFADLIAAEIIASMHELQDNVFLHSRAPEKGLVGYAARAGTFEAVVSDSGVGVLATLRGHPDYAAVADSGTALRIAATDGESRSGRGTGSGFGMGRMFHALVNHDGRLRFRSGDHAMTVFGHSPSLDGRVEVNHKAHLPGLTISVLCRTRPSKARAE